MMLGESAAKAWRSRRGEDDEDDDQEDDDLDGGHDGGRDDLAGGDGDDTYLYDNVRDAIEELIGEGHDRIESLLDDLELPDNIEDLIFTGRGAFRGIGNALGNLLRGGSDDDYLDGDDGDDDLEGGNGDDDLIGGRGDDVLTGGSGHDSLNGGTGTDTMVGGSGRDIYVVDRRTDVVRDVAGTNLDTVRAAASYVLGRYLDILELIGSQDLDGKGNGGSNDLSGNTGDNTLSGLSGDDDLDGDRGDDDLEGDDGDDTCLGGSGDDHLDGGRGNDSLSGGAGIDTLNGGAGADVFTYAKATEGGDTIRGFSRIQGDRLSFLRSAFGGLNTGRLSAARFVANASGTATDGTQRFIYNTSTHVLTFDRDGSGSAAAVEIAELAGGGSLQASDIVIRR